jgi:lycopene cyclase domain-containing protein
VSFALPFAFSFHPKVRFSERWKYVLPALALSAVFFILWDSLFTSLRVWEFNPKYVTGMAIFNLPVEEVLFFFCIPYACLFTFHALTQLVEKDHLFPHQEIITSVLIMAALVGGIYFMDRLYTSSTLLMTGFFLSFLLLKARPYYMGRFYTACLILIIPFLLINGVLTGSFADEPVVWYNNAQNSGFRLGTIPAEDAFYGLLMILLPVFIADKLESWYPQKRKTLKVQGSSI